MKYLLVLAVGLLASLVGSCSKSPGRPDPQASKFRPGQVWAFETPPDQPDARLTILRVEDGGKMGTIVHVALTGVWYGRGHTRIDHLPFAESALEQSVTKLEVESGPVPEANEGYRLWREAFEAGQGGVFRIKVAEAFQVVTRAAENGK